MWACDLFILGGYIPRTAKVCPESGNKGGLTLWSHRPYQGAEPSLPGRSGSQSSLQLLSIASELASLFGMEKLSTEPICRISSWFAPPRQHKPWRFKVENLSGCLDWWLGTRDNPPKYCAQLHPVTRGTSHRESPAGLVATVSCNPAMGIERQQISLVWREGERAEANTVCIYSSRSPFFQPRSYR